MCCYGGTGLFLPARLLRLLHLLCVRLSFMDRTVLNMLCCHGGIRHFPDDLANKNPDNNIEGQYLNDLYGFGKDMARRNSFTAVCNH